jgi:hypothetical protein
LAGAAGITTRSPIFIGAAGELDVPGHETRWHSQRVQPKHFFDEERDGGGPIAHKALQVRLLRERVERIANLPRDGVEPGGVEEEESREQHLVAERLPVDLGREQVADEVVARAPSSVRYECAQVLICVAAAGTGWGDETTRREIGILTARRGAAPRPEGRELGTELGGQS